MQIQKNKYPAIMIYFDYIKLIQQDLKDARNKMAKLRKKNESIDEAKFRVTFDIEDAKLGRYTTDVEADDTKDAEKKVAAKFVGGEKLITKGKTNTRWNIYIGCSS